MRSALPLGRIAQAVARLFGLEFGPERHADLQRALDATANETGMTVEALAEALVAGLLGESVRDTLASHLTVGETYFFRAPEFLDALRSNILPSLLSSRADTRRLRFWSAGCCTGEEPYTLAMLLRETIPDIDGWQISILATDVNPRFLQKAQQGVYGEWSFRATPDALRSRYFRPAGKGLFAIDESIRRMVSFLPLNLSEELYPSIATGTNAMDLILCRNVLMYFEEAQAGGAIGRLRAALRDGGWLSVAPCETSSLFAGFETTRLRGAIFYRKTTGAAPATSAPSREATPRHAGTHTAPPARLAMLAGKGGASRPARTAAGDSRPPAGRVRVAAPAHEETAPHPLGHEAKLLADQGRLTEALALCERWTAERKLDVAAHYLRALVEIELGELAAAEASLRRCVYLAPDEPMIHFSMGNLERLRGRLPQALRSYRYVLQRVGGLRADAPVGYSDGLLAGQLAALVSDVIATERIDDQAA